MASAARSVYSDRLRSSERCMASSSPLAGVLTLPAGAAALSATAAASCPAFRLARRDLVGSTPPEGFLLTSAEGSSCSPPPEVLLPTAPMPPELVLPTPARPSPTLCLRRIAPLPSLPARSPELLRRIDAGCRDGERRSPDERRTTSEWSSLKIPSRKFGERDDGRTPPPSCSNQQSRQHPSCYTSISEFSIMNTFKHETVSALCTQAKRTAAQPCVRAAGGSGSHREVRERSQSRACHVWTALALALRCAVEPPPSRRMPCGRCADGRERRG
jgi:hypothetical protein